MERSIDAYQVMQEDLEYFVKLFKKYQELNFKPRPIFSEDEESDLRFASQVFLSARDYDDEQLILAYDKMLPFLDKPALMYELKQAVSNQ